MPAVDNSGLSKLWSRIEEFFSPRGHTHSSATASAPGYMSAEDKAKLDGIDPEAAKVDVDSALSATSENPVQNKVVKAALDGKAASSHSHPTYANQNAFSHVAVGSVDVAADSATDTLTIVAGTNVTITRRRRERQADGCGEGHHLFRGHPVRGRPHGRGRQEEARRCGHGRQQLHAPIFACGDDDNPGRHAPVRHRHGEGRVEREGSRGIPHADRHAQGADGIAGTSTTQIATTAFVQSAVAAASVGAAKFRGSVTSNAAISGSAYKQGWYWVVGAEGTYVGEECEPGDMIFCNTDKGSAYSARPF